MKNTKSLTLLLSTILIASHSIDAIAANGMGQDAKLVREGTRVLLSPSEIADLRVWVENAKHDLDLLQDDNRRGTLEERRIRIVRDFEAIVGRSGRKENEILMRYTLNRALEVDELVGAHPAPSELQSLVAFLDSTVVLSKGFYTDDIKYLEAIGRGASPELQTPMPVFAYQYAEMILRFSRTFLRPELEYSLTFNALGWLANDLNSDRNLLRINFAETITRIARLQKRFPQQPQGHDQQLLKDIRDFKWEYRERVLNHIENVNANIREALTHAEAKKAEDDRRARIKEEERKAELARIEQEKIAAEESRRRKIEEDERLEKFKRGMISRNDLISELLSYDRESDRLYGRVFVSRTSGRVFQFDIKNGGLRLSHGANESRHIESIDGDYLVHMKDGSRWSLAPNKDPNCIDFFFNSGRDTLCSSATLPINHKVDRRGIYVSRNSARYLILEGKIDQPEATYVHGSPYGPYKPIFESPNALRYSVGGTLYTFEWIDDNCVSFSWGKAESDTLCRNRQNDLVPHGIYRSQSSSREMIFRKTENNSMDVEYTGNGPRTNFIYENGVGYIPRFKFGFEVEDRRCILLIWGNTSTDRLCRRGDD